MRFGRNREQAMYVQIDHVRAFWNDNPCSSKLSSPKERKAYFNEIQQKRYYFEPHIPIIAKFGQFRGCDVLEVGCGIGTDGLQLARNLEETEIRQERQRNAHDRVVSLFSPNSVAEQYEKLYAKAVSLN